MKGFLVFLTAFMVGFFALVLWLYDARSDREEACDRAGGVAVKSHIGPLVCIDRDALIENGW